jgi:hypothetical protein
VILGRRYALSSMTAATRLRLGVAVSGFLALVAVYGPVDVPCLFTTATGIQCPACGLTRSVASIARGDLGASLAYHPAGIGIAGIAFAALLVPTQTQRVYSAVSSTWGDLHLAVRIALGVSLVVAAWAWNLQRVIPQ